MKNSESQKPQQEIRSLKETITALRAALEEQQLESERRVQS